LPQPLIDSPASVEILPAPHKGVSQFGRQYRPAWYLHTPYTNPFPQRIHEKKKFEIEVQPQADMNPLQPIDSTIMVQFQAWMDKDEGVVSLPGLEANPTWFRELLHSWLDDFVSKLLNNYPLAVFL